jgi:tetratricopeptide (TPR) repeat protein
MSDPLTVALVPQEGTDKLDAEIRQLQEQIRVGKNTDVALERLGWSFVAKARQSFDPGYYRLAEACALGLEARHSHSPEGLLLRGHVLHNLHRFKQAEPLARELVAQRGLPFDFGLLGDVLMEQGKLDEAVVAYQKMVDLRPDLHSYARGAHLRWLKGNLAGAERLMRMAVTAASPLDAESAAWVHTRLAGYQFQSGAVSDAERTCAQALDFQKDYPPALLLRGRLLLSQGKPAEAVGALQRAAELNPLPEFQWTLAEALRADGRADEAAAVEGQLRQKAAATDPRTYSLFLATRGDSVEAALRLAEDELNNRADVFTHDALAWALAASGKLDQANQQMSLGLAEGTKDARLCFHAAIIAHKLGQDEQARQWAQKANGFQQTLLPSEREQLNQAFPPAVTVAARGGDPNQKGHIQ